MGQLRLTGTMPSGHAGTLMPGRMYFVDDACATLDGADLGQPARWPASPVIGAVPLPARGVLAVGQAVFALPTAVQAGQDGTKDLLAGNQRP